jgi:hypothetical protein
MIEGLVQQFLGSGEATGLLAHLQGQGLTAPQAQGALTATAEGTAQVVQEQGLAALGGGGLAGAVGSVLGGGGLAGGLGAMFGGGAPAAGGVPSALVDTVAGVVASKTGLSADLAKMAVNLVLPHVIAFVKSKLA